MSPENSYLFHLVHDFLEFRQPELEVICQSVNHPNCIQNSSYSNDSSVFTCNLPSDEVAFEIGKKSFLLKSISKLINQAESFDSLLRKIESIEFPFQFEDNDTFKIDIYVFGKIYSQQEKLDKIEKLVDACKFEQKNLKVCLNDKLVKHKFIYVEEWIQTDSKTIEEDFDESNLENLENGKFSGSKYLRKCFFTKFLCNGQNSVIHKYNLKDRGFIGNTSMKPILSLVMANMAQVTQNSFIYDPFVGTGSLLVGVAHCGGYVAGADLDYNLIHSRGLSSRMGQKYRKKDETIRNNLKQYGLENKFIDILAADFSTKYIRHNFKFDSIITDPPYGIREKAKRIGQKKRNENEKIEEDKDFKLILNQQPQHTKYNLGDIYYDLLDFASEHLNQLGRIVYWLPVYLEIERDKMTTKEIRNILQNFIPSHKDLSILYFSEQRLTKFTSRILVTMEKSNPNELHDSFNSFNLSHEKSQNKIEPEKKTDMLNQFRDKYFSSRK